MTKVERMQMLNADLRAGRIVIPSPAVVDQPTRSDRADAILYAWLAVNPAPMNGAGRASP